jgi:O-acetyl-ADP-ribose deacetylase (regulator of RNase III)
MEDMIKICLNMAAADQFSSIAFPAVGCGFLGYSPRSVIECFLKAQAATNTTTEVTCSVWDCFSSVADNFITIGELTKKSKSN